MTKIIISQRCVVNGSERLRVDKGLLALMIALACPGLARGAIVVSQDPTVNLACSGGRCVPSASSAVLNVGTLNEMLASGSVTIATTGAGGAQAYDIVVTSAPAWTSQTTLSLDAFRSIRIAAPMSVQGTATLSLTTNDAGGSHGLLHVSRQGAVSFPGKTGHLVVNSAAYTLVAGTVELAAQVAANPAGHFALTRDYDASADGVYAMSPVPTPLTGDFEGLGHAISNLTIVNGTKQAVGYGLFTSVAAGGSIENLSLTALKIDVKGPNAGAGGVAGGMGGTLSYVDTEGVIFAKNGVAGGLAADASGLIIYSSAKVRVHAATAGGLVGGLGFQTGTIFGSFAAGEVVGPMDRQSGGIIVGGLVGRMENSRIEQSYSTASVSTIGRPGNASSGPFYIGGLAGSVQVRVRISNSYALAGKVTVKQSDLAYQANVGGLVGNGVETGSTDLKIEHCYAANQIGTHLRSQGGPVGGIAGVVSQGVFGDDYWDTTTSGVNVAAGSSDNGGPIATALTSEQLQSGLPAGFDPAIWAIAPGINGGFPYLRSNAPSR